ncbi:hypothetical protein T06_1219 [Trichinella sp. T6]|nr:hypothetical protein T06_1219 [Trichinella sp. T6]
MVTEQPSFNMELAAIAGKLSAFWPQSPLRLWFPQAEIQFELRHISAPLTKYYYVISSLPDYVVPDDDYLFKVTGDNLYETLKQRLLERYGELDDDRLNALTTPVVAGDMKPSQLLRGMRRICDTDLDPNAFLFKKLFLQHLFH